MQGSVGTTLGTTMRDILTVPADKVRLLSMLQIANVDGTNDVTVTVQWRNASHADRVTRLVHEVPIAARDSLAVDIGSLALVAGDKLEARCETGAAKITVSYNERDA